MKRLTIIGIGVLAAMAGECGGDGTSESTVAPILDDVSTATFVTGIDHPYLPFAPGTTWSYEGIEDDEVERIEVIVTGETRLVNGITAVVVRDTVTVDGELIEDTYDWYAQDSDGNVWYLGEDSREYENGEFVSTAGSWETGVDGAEPGIIMYGDPDSHIGTPYRQEFYVGEAEDVAQIVETNATVIVGGTTYTNVLVIKEWNPLEAGVAENKYYASGIGVILEEVVEGARVGSNCSAPRFRDDLTPGPGMRPWRGAATGTEGNWCES